MAALMAVANFLMMIVLTILGPLLWLLLRAAILILIYIVLALIVLAFTIGIGIFALISLPIALITGSPIIYTVNKLEATLFDNSILLGYEILNEFNKFLQAEIPYVYFSLSLNGEIALELILKIFPPAFDFGFGGTKLSFESTESFMKSTNSNNVLLNSKSSSTYPKLIENNDYESILKESSGSEGELIIRNPLPSSTNFEGFEFLTPLIFEYTGENGETGNIYYRITRIDTETPYIVDNGVVCCEWDSNEETYIGTKIIDLKEGVFELYTKVLGEQIEKTIKFNVYDLEYILDGLDFGLTLLTGINLILGANEANIQYKWQLFGATMSYLFIPIIISYIGSSLSSGESSDLLPLNMLSNIFNENLEYKFSFGKGFIFAILLNILFGSIATYSSSDDFVGLADCAFLLENLMPKWTISTGGAYSNCLLLFIALNFIFNDLGLAKTLGSTYDTTFFERIFQIGTFSLFTIYPWIKSLKVISIVSKMSESWKKQTFPVYLGFSIGGVLILALLEFLYHGKYML